MHRLLNVYSSGSRCPWTEGFETAGPGSDVVEDVLYILVGVEGRHVHTEEGDRRVGGCWGVEGGSLCPVLARLYLSVQRVPNMSWIFTIDKLEPRAPHFLLITKIVICNFLAENSWCLILSSYSLQEHIWKNFWMNFPIVSLVYRIITRSYFKFQWVENLVLTWHG